MNVNNSPKYSAITANPFIAIKIKNISPSIIPKDKNIAISNPEASALDTQARTPGLGIITVKNNAPENVSNSFVDKLYTPI